MIHVSSLSRLRDVAASLGSFDMLTMLSPGSAVGATDGLTPERHLHLAFHDIVEARPEFVMPDHEAVLSILGFGRSWNGAHPMLIHCWAGISRSSAAAYIMTCDRNPGCERDLANELRRRAPFATPNRLMVALADDLLSRNGVMIDAIGHIGRGADAFEGIPYQLPARWSPRG
ncbi:MAG: protein tyrosine phosphatase [Proteobacteria bacterium]|nr:protein tyrosine phosphatase [Pseudomonadota bacterium]